MSNQSPVSIHWMRRDLRLSDNAGLHHSLKGDNPVILLFIFDTDILDQLPEADARVSFIHQQLRKINDILKDNGSSLLVKHGQPLEVWKDVLGNFDVKGVTFNRDYEPYALKRDQSVANLLKERGVDCQTYKDQVIFEKHEVCKANGDPYTVYTPYKNKWLERFKLEEPRPYDEKSFENLLQSVFDLPSLQDIGFQESSIQVPEFDLSVLDNYGEKRDLPVEEGTSRIGPHLRFGTIGIRDLIARLDARHDVFLSELIWREFFMQILFHFPDVEKHNFRRKYDRVPWRNDENEFKRWCEGRTGYPFVDAGMRQLNTTGFMHNRVRMIVASFLCKHLLIDWRWGEAYFAEKLLDYELASNNGNWQWAAGTGCDAAPYFRIFNPYTQVKKFDPDQKYISTWVADLEEDSYPDAMVEHKAARERALEAYGQVKE